LEADKTKLWGSRFSRDIDEETLAYTETVDIDKRLVVPDLWGSLAHVLMLARASIIPEADARCIAKKLLEYLEEAQHGAFSLRRELEDVHLNIEQRLTDDIGSSGGRLHTARSRNDQVVTDARMYIRSELITLMREVQAFVSDLLQKANGETETLILGYTHSQPAQPISYGFWLSCYASMLLRDLNRLGAAFAEVNVSPLGGCALAGTSFAIDRELTARLLGFDSVLLHALDATSTRDFLITTLSALAILATGLSRAAEEVVWWSGKEYGLLTVDDVFATGSSIMPQKKNPVVAELARAKCAVAIGALNELLVIMKGVPSAYSCDLQQDKPPAWRALDNTRATVSILRSQFASMQLDRERGEQLCWESFSTATELANYLVEERGLPFRKAYSIVGFTVKKLESQSKTLRDTELVAEMLQGDGIEVSAKVLSGLVDPRIAVQRQASSGSTGLKATEEMLGKLRTELSARIRENDRREEKLEKAFTDTVTTGRQFVEGAKILVVLPTDKEE
jgi:argininosuccinate lyase